MIRADSCSRTGKKGWDWPVRLWPTLALWGVLAGSVCAQEVAPAVVPNAPLSITDHATLPVAPSSVGVQLPANPQVQDTPLPITSDGLMGNRQVALTPFPNLHMQSGPLEQHQLPWFRASAARSAFEAEHWLQFDTAIGGLKSNGVNDSEFGLYNSLIYARPFWKERNVGLEVGATLEPTTFPQILVQFTAGFYRTAVWMEDPERIYLFFRDRLSWGVVYDALFDSENRVLIGQVRSQLGYAMTPNRECGLWFTVPMQEDEYAVGSPEALNIGATGMVNFYYRQTFGDNWDGTLFMGVAESPGGGQIGGYCSYRFASQASWTFSGVRSLENHGAYAIYTGLRFDFTPLSTYRLISGNPHNRYRPFVPMADHINFQVRKEPLVNNP